jgi:hypothetical protein
VLNVGGSDQSVGAHWQLVTKTLKTVTKRTIENCIVPDEDEKDNAREKTEPVATFLSVLFLKSVYNSCTSDCAWYGAE